MAKSLRNCIDFPKTSCSKAKDTNTNFTPLSETMTVEYVKLGNGIFIVPSSMHSGLLNQIQSSSEDDYINQSLSSFFFTEILNKSMKSYHSTISFIYNIPH